jgi:glucose-1-phosphate adenylyltransferase
MPGMNDILGLILGGGRGQRLYPLTRERSKPAIPIAGKYRLIDIPISNCINSGINRIAILTQFNSVSLHRHIAQTYNFDAFHSGWVQVLAAEQTPQHERWYQGTADAVRMQLSEIQSSGAEYILVLAGDQLYHMDFAALAKAHWEKNADITIAVQPVRSSDAGRFGILQRRADGRITGFVEKPRDPQVLARFVSRDDVERPYIGSMGIYFFKTSTLVDLLANSTDDDFGGDVIPKAIQSLDVYGFDFDGYFEDLGTIRSFYETNLSLARPDPPFDLHDPEHPIYTHPRFLPGSVILGGRLSNVLLADGCRIGRAEIEDAVVGLRGQVSDGVDLRRSILMGADYYDETLAEGQIPLGIGPHCSIEGAIIDKNARLGANVVIKPFQPGIEVEGKDWVVRDGIVIIPKNTTIPAGTVIAPGR